MRLLLVEDDKKLSHAMCYWLKQNHYEVDACYLGNEVSYYISEGSYDCILLDRMLPGKDGICILKELRNAGNKIPIILITALDSLQNKLEGFDCGADDYLVKPFEFPELEARIRSVTRRSFCGINSSKLYLEDITYDTAAYKLSGPVSELILSKKEGSVMEAFLCNQDKPLSKEILHTKVWGIDTDVEISNLDNYIHFLRRRLKTVGSCVKIKNIWGIGYCLEKE